MCASQTLLSQNKLSECRGRNLRLISVHDTVLSVFVLELPLRGAWEMPDLPRESLGSPRHGKCQMPQPLAWLHRSGA